MHPTIIFTLTLAVLGSACTFYTCPGNCGPSAAASGNQAGNGGSSGGQIVDGPKPTGKWVIATANLTDLKSECGNMSYLSAKPDEDELIAGVALNGLWASTDGGQKWSALGQDPTQDMFYNRPTFVLYDPKSASTYWETGIYNGLGSFKTTDDGATFSALGTSHDDYISIDFTDSKRKTILVSGHEADHLLHQSTDGGKTWKQLGGNEPKEAGACSFPLVLDAQTYLLGCRAWGDAKSGIYRSADAGATWTLVTDAGGSAAPLVASNGDIYFASDAMAGLVRSTDQGQTWTMLGKVGSIQAGVAPIELPDGRLAAVNQQRVVVSADQGVTWTVISVDAPFVPVGLVYSTFRKAFYVWYFSCGDGTLPVPDNAIMSYDFDYAQ